VMVLRDVRLVFFLTTFAITQPIQLFVFVNT
jgi:hypothetical protein